jgi:hypothetical protein
VNVILQTSEGIDSRLSAPMLLILALKRVLLRFLRIPNKRIVVTGKQRLKSHLKILKPSRPSGLQKARPYNCSTGLYWSHRRRKGRSYPSFYPGTRRHGCLCGPESQSFHLNAKNQRYSCGVCSGAIRSPDTAGWEI